MATVPAIFHPYLSFSIIIIIIITLPMTCSMSETEALLSLKNSFSNNAGALESWVAGSRPCSEDEQWEGVICYNGLVTGLRLQKMGLSGEINVDALLQLKGLRTISLASNSFTGPIPELNKIGFLKAVYLTGNKFSGEIPQNYFQGMRSLKKLWLAGNEFTGQIPSSLVEISQLMELHLENNQFTGRIPNLDNNPSLVDLNLSNNKLEGEVPASLLKFNESSFAGNSGICGEKFGKKCGEPIEETHPVDPKNKNNVGDHEPEPLTNRSSSSSSSRSSTSMQIIGIVLTSLVLILVAAFFIMKSRQKKDNDDFSGNIGQEMNVGEFEVQVTAPVKRDHVDVVRKTSSSRRGSSHSSGKSVGELVLMSDEKGSFGLPDLMKAAAEVLGNGAFGSTYKAVMANGVAVVVKRTRELNALGKDGFDAEMKRIGKLKHWNILTPLAYHYRKDEKLVISEYVPRGSLLYLLHGDRGPSHAELNWHARLKIVLGIAEGMRYLHTELASYDLPHGNLKSSNVLLGPEYEPLLVDYGFIHLVDPAIVTHALFAYKAPEAAQHGQVSPSCDVYCLGVVILEILTGKFPSQYLSNGKGGTDVVQWVASAISEGRVVELLDPEIATSRNSLGEMEQLLHIGAACTQSNPHKRLDIVEAVRRIEELNNMMGGQESRAIEVLPSPKS